MYLCIYVLCDVISLTLYVNLYYVRDRKAGNSHLSFIPTANVFSIDRFIEVVHALIPIAPPLLS